MQRDVLVAVVRREGRAEGALGQRGQRFSVASVRDPDGRRGLAHLSEMHAGRRTRSTASCAKRAR